MRSTTRTPPTSRWGRRDLDAKQLAALQALTRDLPELKRELRVGINGVARINLPLLAPTMWCS